MTDDTFHLTPLDVRRYEFQSALRGYDRTQVDAFREQVAGEMERLARAVQELDTRAKGFHEQLRAFRERDKALNDALISAQQLRSELKEQATREAELIIREARAEAERILDEAQVESRAVKTQFEDIIRSRRTYLARLKALTERQLAEIQVAWELATGEAGGEQRGKGEGGAEEQRPTPDWLQSLVDEE